MVLGWAARRHPRSSRRPRIGRPYPPLRPRGLLQGAGSQTLSTQSCRVLLSCNVNTNHLPGTLKRAADSVHLPGDARAPSADRTLSSKADYKSQLTSGPIGGQGGKRGRGWGLGKPLLFSINQSGPPAGCCSSTDLPVQRREGKLRLGRYEWTCFECGSWAWGGG